MPNSERFDREATLWDEKPDRLKLAGEVAAAMQAAVPPMPAMRVLDFGCGTGLVSLPWAHRVGQLTGMDASAGMLEVFRAKAAQLGLNNVSTSHFSAGQTPPALDPFDLIVSSMTLHHVADIPQLLGQLKSLLAPEGRLCLADLDPDDGQFHADPSGVFHHGFARAALVDQVRRAGFDRVDIGTATTLKRPGADGIMREFSLFLLVAAR